MIWIKSENLLKKKGSNLLFSLQTIPAIKPVGIQKTTNLGIKSCKIREIFGLSLSGLGKLKNPPLILYKTPPKEKK